MKTRIVRPRMKINKYIISWMFNGFTLTREFLTEDRAMKFYWTLRDNGYEPSLHMR